MHNLPVTESVILLTVLWISVWRVSAHYFTGMLPTFLAWFITALVQTFRPF